MKKDSFNANEIPADKGLSGNEKIEEAIAALQEEPSQELLAHTLTVIRRRMQEDGQLILAVEPPAGEAQLRIQAVQTSDGKQWWSAFTCNSSIMAFSCSVSARGLSGFIVGRSVSDNL